MTEGRARDDWNRAAMLMAVVAQCHAGKGRKFTPADFNPFAQSRGMRVNKSNIGEMRDVFKQAFGKVEKGSER